MGMSRAPEATLLSANMTVSEESAVGLQGGREGGRKGVNGERERERAQKEGENSVGKNIENS